MKITIALADDHDLVRRSIASLLDDEPDFEVIGECADGREMLELVVQRHPAVVIVDIAMSGLNGIETALQIRAMSPTTRVIALSNYTDEIYVRSLLEAGVVGYIVKSGAAQDLIRAIREGARGKPYLSEAVAHFLSNVNGASEGREDRKGRNVLSGRQREVLQLIAEGYSSPQIAAKLGLRETTIKSHRKNIMEKLDIHDKAGLTRHAIRIGLVRAD